MIWIRIEDRLPEEWDRVLICDVNDETDDYATEDEINLIVSVLKNNIPFDVVGENYVSH